MIAMNDFEFGLLKDYLRNISGIDIPAEKRYLFKTRLSSLIKKNNYQSFLEFYHHLTKDKTKKLELQLVQEMATHESRFLRDGHPFFLLKEKLLPKVADHCAKGSTLLPPRIRILSAGCSTGQETYSIAIMVREWLKTQSTFSDKNVTIIGIDISEKVLKKARQGIYAEKEVRIDHAPALRESYFSCQSNGWHINDEIKKMVSFARINLVDSLKHLGKMDIIFCRNVIIYFPIDLKKKIVKGFHDLLNEHGAMVMGASEAIFRLSDKFRVINEHGATYFAPKKK